MPKVIHHNRRRALSLRDAGESNHAQCSVSMTGTGPRKVSFEEAQYSLGSFSSSQDSFVIPSDPSVSFPCRSLQDSKESSDIKDQKIGLQQRSQLRRPTPSVCLASLAGCVGSAECSGSSSQERPTPASPISPCGSGQSGGDSQTSPWGHFVDILIPPAHEQAAGEASAAAIHRDYESSQPCNSFATRLRDSILHVPYSRTRRPFSSAIEPYPRAATRRRSGKVSTFLPGMILETPTNKAMHSEIKDTSHDVVQALTRLSV